MKTVQDLISLCDRERLWEEYAKLCDIPHDKMDIAAQRFYGFIDTLLTTQIFAPGDNTVFCEPIYNEGRICYDSVVISASDVKEFFRPLEYFDKLEGVSPERISDELALSLIEEHSMLIEKGKEILGNSKAGSYPGYIESYAYEFEPWNEILAYYVPHHIIGSPEQYIYAAAVLYEMSFFGYDKAAVEKERKELDESIAEAEQMKALPSEEQKKHSHSIDEVFEELGYTDDRTEEEKERDKFKIRKDDIISSLLQYREMRKVYDDLTCDMKYFITDKERDGTWYHEWAKGRHNGENFWNDDSILLSVETMRDIGVYKFFYDVIPHYDKYESAVIDKDLWEHIKERSKEYSTQIQECIAEAESWVQETFKQYDVFTIIGQ